MYKNVLFAVCAMGALFASANSAMCTRPAPGVRKMIRGVDITELDLVPLTISGTDGFRYPVVKFTCGQNRTWTNDGVDYQLPDQVWHMTTLSGGWLTTDVEIFKSFRDVRTNMNKEVGGEGNIWKFSFSASASYSTMQNTITNISRFISDTSAFDSASRIDLIPDWVLSLDNFAIGFLQRFVSNRTYASDPDVYQRFIDNFGTHYFAMAKFGGYIRVVHETSSSYFYSHTDQQAKRNARASFLKIISAHGATVSGATTVDSQFSSASSQTVKYYGGSTNLLASDGIQTWQPTVDGDPWLFSGELKPISDLIADSVQKTNMKTAVVQYVLRRYLQEIQRLIRALIFKYGSSGITNALEGRLLTLESKPLGGLVEAEVEALARDVQTQMMVPAWFTRNTRLCYKWWPDGDGGQCGGGASRLLCALPGAMTPNYRDDTDGRGGGCRMTWSIQSKGFEPWFSQVQVCYRWHPDGDGGQCGGGAEHLLCAPVNKYSAQYRDDTDGRGGGCQMSWRIVIPSNAPLWMRNTQLCFSWYPDGDGGQCGPAQARDMCATANSWTPYYRDDTDGRGGGCQMRWGLRLRP